jgi:hypothetical protein
VLCVAFQFLGVLEKELAKFEKNKDDFLSDFTQVIQQKHLRNSSHGLAGRLGACILSFVFDISNSEIHLYIPGGLR